MNINSHTMLNIKKLDTKTIRKGFLAFFAVLFLGFFIAFFQNTAEQNNLIYTAFVISVFFSLPMLISKSIFKSPYISIYTLISYLYYPITYLLFFIVKSIFQVDPIIILKIFSLITVLLWFYFNIKLTQTETHKELLNKASVIVFILITIVWILTLNTFAGRTINSVTANDYLVHNAAINQMVVGKQLCFIPSQCSNLFVLDAYTTFYHTFILQMANGFNISYLSFGYVLDMVFGSFIALYILALFKKFQLNTFYAVLGSLLVVGVFEHGAFTYQSFVPQTFVFFMFLHLILSKKIILPWTLIGILIILMTHFAVGIYVSVLYGIYLLFKNDFFYKKFKIFNNNWIILFLIVGLAIAFLLNTKGFSIETTFQSAEIEKFGTSINYPFPHNVLFLFEILGLNSIILIIAVLYLSVNKLHTKYTQFALAYILTVCTVFFLGPIYNNKFLIGIGISSIFLILTALYEWVYDNGVKVGTILVVIAVTLLSFYTQYSFFLKFYIQDDGSTSAVNAAKDSKLIEYLKRTNINCIFISDPETQLEISALTKNITDRGSYSSLDSRRILQNMMKTPSKESLSKIFDIETVQDKDVCFVHTARLQQLVQDDTETWVNQVYYYIIDTSNVLKEDGLTRVFKNLNLKPMYLDPYFVIYRIRKPL